MLDQTDRVRDLAYRLWEQEGRPPGREMEHWLEAERHVSVPAPTAKPKTTPARKPKAAKKK